MSDLYTDYNKFMIIFGYKTNFKWLIKKKTEMSKSKTLATHLLAS